MQRAREAQSGGERPGWRIGDRVVAVQPGPARLLTAVRISNTGLLVPALLVGAGAGVGAIVFRWLITSVTSLLSGHADYSAAGHAANPHRAGLGR